MVDLQKTFNEFAEQAADIAYPVFTYHGWEYFDGAPSRERLAETVLDLLETIAPMDAPMTMSSGRFLVEKVHDPEIGEDLYSVNLELVGDI